MRRVERWIRRFCIVCSEGFNTYDDDAEICDVCHYQILQGEKNA